MRGVTEGEDPAAALVRRFHRLRSAFYSGGPIEPLANILAEDVRWHVPGRNAIAGDYDGRDDVLAYFKRRRELARASFQLEVREVVAAAELVFQSAEPSSAQVRVAPGRPWESSGFHAARFTKCWPLPFDQCLFDEVWS